MTNKMIIYLGLAIGGVGLACIVFLLWHTVLLQKRIESYQNAVIEAQNQITANFNKSLEALADGNEEKIIEKQRIIERIKPVEAKISFNHLSVLRRTFDRLFFNSQDAGNRKNSDITEAENARVYARGD